MDAISKWAQFVGRVALPPLRGGEWCAAAALC
jgi:hypothetical protein